METYHRKIRLNTDKLFYRYTDGSITKATLSDALEKWTTPNTLITGTTGSDIVVSVFLKQNIKDLGIYNDNNQTTTTSVDPLDPSEDEGTLG